MNCHSVGFQMRFMFKAFTTIITLVSFEIFMNCSAMYFQMNLSAKASATWITFDSFDLLVDIFHVLVQFTLSSKALIAQIIHDILLFEGKLLFVFKVITWIYNPFKFTSYGCHNKNQYAARFVSKLTIIKN